MHFPSKLLPGAILGGRYRIEQRIGSGGMSHVFCATDLRLQGKKWAVKETVSHPKQHARLEEEAQLLIRLNHSRLPHIVDFFPPDTEGYTYLIMDFIEGVTLEHYTESLPERLSDQEIIRLAEQICEGLDYLHHHNPPVVYRDLKPSNLMVDGAGNIRFIDFGIARQFKLDQPEDTIKLGTIGFAAPEQYGGRQTDARTDLYSLGALLLYLISKGSHSEWRPETDQWIASRSDLSGSAELLMIIRKLLQYEPENRYSSVQELRKDIHERLGGMSAIVDGSVSDKSQPSRTRVIAVLGVSGGVGTTHTAIMLGYSLCRHFKKVTLLELSDKSSAFSRLQSAVAGRGDSEPQTAERQFNFKGVRYYRRPSRIEMLNLIAGEDGLLVLDLGSDRSKEAFEEFLRADISLVVGSGAEWRFQDILSFCRISSAYPGSKWIYTIPAVSMEVIQYLRRKLGTSRLVPLPFEDDPFHPGEDTIQAMESLCRAILQKPKPVRWFSFKFQKKMWGGGS